MQLQLPRQRTDTCVMWPPAVLVVGNLCAHRECAECLLGLGLREVLTTLAPLCKADPTVHKYVLRIQQKLQQQQAAGALGGSGAANVQRQ